MPDTDTLQCQPINASHQNIRVS